MSSSARGTAYTDQAAAAAREAREVFEELAAGDDRARSYGIGTPWLADLLTKVVIGPPRFTRCKHLRGITSPVPMYLAAHTRRLQCARCIALAGAAMRGTREDRTCDCCRRLMPKGTVLTFATLVDNIVVTAGHCASCTEAVRGARA